MDLAGLIVFRQEGMLANVVEIEADQIFLGLSGVVVGHSSSSLDVPGQIVLAVPMVPSVGTIPALPTAHVRGS